MPTITLPDGSQRSFPSPVDGGTVARSIGPRLERDAVAVRIDGTLKDLTLPIEHDARVEIVTRTSADGLELLRHDAAHVMAEAVKELYPETQVTIGPAIENGFYYDFARSEPFTPEDLERIEKRMHEIVARDEKIVREVWDRDAAVEFFLEAGRALQSRDHRRYPCRRADHAVPPRRVHRSVPRPALAVDGAARLGLQAHEARRRLLARRFAERDAATHLRHGMGRRQGAEGLSRPPRGSRAPRPSQARQADGPLSLPGRSRRRRVLAHEGLATVPHARRLHAREARRRGLPRGQHAGAHVALALGGLGALGQLPREHVHERHGGEADVRRQADELPRPHPSVQERSAQLSRSAATASRSSARCTATNLRARCTGSCA